MQDFEPSIPHLYTLDLSKNRFHQALRILCENMQATTALAARRSFTPGSAALRSFTLGQHTGPPTCIKPNMGFKTALQSSGTCPAPIQPPDRRRRCLFIAQVHVTRNVESNMVTTYYYESSSARHHQMMRFCLHLVQCSRSIIRRHT